MKNAFLLFLFLLCFEIINAQMGILLGTTTSKARTWQISTDNYITNGRQDFLKFGTTAGLDYTFSLVDHLIEFQPAFNVSRITSSLTHYQNGITHDFELYTIGFQLNTNIFFLNFLHRQDDSSVKFSFPRNLYFRLSPGFDLIHMSYDYPELIQDGEPVLFKKMSSRKYELNIGFQLGLNYELSELLSISPLFGFRYFPSVRWENLTQITSEGMAVQSFDDSSIKQLSFGLRIGLHIRK